MRTFVMQRDEDETGISGTGVVAEGVMFTDGSVVLRWRGEHRSTVLWDSIDHVEAIHGHGGKTRIVWDGDARPPWRPPVLDMDRGQFHPYITGCVLPDGHDGRCALNLNAPKESS